MKKKMFSMALAIVVCMPCVLIFDGGPRAAYGEESLQWTNFLGLAWFGFLALGGFKMITPKWMRKELSENSCG